MRANFDIDDALLAEAQAVTSAASMKETVRLGLEMLVRLGRQAQLRRLRGQLHGKVTSTYCGTTTRDRRRLQHLIDYFNGVTSAEVRTSDDTIGAESGLGDLLREAFVSRLLTDPKPRPDVCPANAH